MASNKKDMRRDDLFIPFIEPEAEKNAADVSGTIASSVPMAAIFSRQKVLGWVAIVFSIQHWLQETPDAKNSGTPAWFSVIMSVASLGICYMPLFMPPPPGRAATGAGAPPPAAPAHS